MDQTAVDASAKLYLDDLQVGQRLRSGTHALDAGQIKEFAARFDPQPFHLDESAAADSLFKGLAASGWHTAAVTMRLLVDGGAPPPGTRTTRPARRELAPGRVVHHGAAHSVVLRNEVRLDGAEIVANYLRVGFEADGSWRLEFPYADHRELIMDILKFGADVEVLAPPELRQRVADEAARLTRLYAAPRK